MKNLLYIIVAGLIFFGCSKPKEEKISTDSGSKNTAIMKTNMGVIELELFTSKCPKTVKNFVELSKQGKYNGLTFHRVIENFMIQGGDPKGNGTGGMSIYDNKEFESEIVDELTFYEAGMLAMANRGPNTNTSQFFITTVPQPSLNYNYTIFGKVLAGMDVAISISKVKTGENDKPVSPIVIESIEIANR